MSKELMLKRIAQAQEEIDAKRALVKQGAQRQDYHFMAETGWINDPNGLIYYKGKYHFFYQYNPYHGFWSSMHWGHAVSTDLIHWDYLPLALAPSEVYDDHLQGGCFSGSAIEYDGKLYLIYTGTSNHGHGFEQVQCVAYSEDGIHFEKYEKNPVITAPAGVSPDQFRDPKVWEHDGTYYVVCGASVNGFGQALLYKSDDLLHWTFVNVLAESRGEWGFMWECPDFFPLEDKYVLMFSPMGGKERTSVYLVGDFDYDTGKFFYTTSGEMDWGFDYYAPQSFLAPDGRRLMVGWANAWDWMPFWKDWGPTYQEGWCGFFSVPREAVLDADGMLKFVPVKELELLREDGVSIQELELVDPVPGDAATSSSGNLSLCNGCVFELKMKVDLQKTTASQLILKLRSVKEKYTEIVFDLAKSEIRFDRSHSDNWSTGVAKCPLNLLGRDTLDIHVYSDKSSVELFSNGYRNNLSCNIYNADENQENYLIAKDGTIAITELNTWKLKKVIE